MSKSALTLGVTKNTKESQPAGLDRKTLESPEAQMALELLKSRLLVKDPESGQMEGLDIELVDVYDEGLDPLYVDKFDSKDRQPGTLFVIKYRGTALVNVVVDPVKRSVVHIRSVSAANNKSTSPASNLKRLLGDDFVDRLDGANLDNPDETGLELANKGPGSSIMDIVATTRDKTSGATSEDRVLVTK